MIKPSNNTRRQRRGLAPLELVLSLPVLLFAMALIVGIGAAACWKVRTQVTARHRAWSDRWPRTVNWIQRPNEWPQSATWESRATPALTTIDLPALQSPVVRGPLDGGIRVDDTLLDPSLNVSQGHSHIERLPPLMPGLGKYKLDVNHDILNSRWQFRQMGFGSNVQRRLPKIYDLPDGQGEAAYRRAYQAILSAPERNAWAVLDRDTELAQFYGSYTDFHPRLNDFCGLDVMQIRQTSVQRLIDRIQGKPPPRRVSSLPERMTQTFLRRYRDELALLTLPDAPPNPARIAELEALIALLQDYLRIVRAS